MVNAFDDEAFATTIHESTLPASQRGRRMLTGLGGARRARLAIATAFLANGVVTGTWAAQIPIIQARLGISHTTLGLALFSMAVGSLVSMPLTAPTIGRLGSAGFLRFTTLGYVAAFLLPVAAPSALHLAAALLLVGALGGAMDVAMNAQAVALETRTGWTIMSALHGVWSLGALVGAGLAGLLLHVVPPFGEVVLVSSALALLALATFPFLLRDAETRRPRGAGITLPTRATVGLGALCFLAMVVEGAVNDWSTLHLKQSLGVSPAFAAWGFSAYAASMAIGRFSGDVIRGRFGSEALVRASGLTAAAGLAIAAFVPVPALAVAALAVTGIGLANLYPVLVGAAARIPGQAASIGIAAVATMGYTGSIVGPPVIGLLADLTSLAVALGLVALASLSVGLAARRARLAR
jgi:MFS family permease